MTPSYADIVSGSFYIASDTQNTYQCFTERHLQALWYEQKYFRDLKTLEGLPIKIISPGIWNSEAGPDFLKAHVIIGDQEKRGDIELHLTINAWKQHGHQEDPRYNQVILHVALWPSLNHNPVNTCNRKSIIQCILEPYLTIPIARIQKLIDLDLYPYKQFLGSGKCAKLLFQGLTLSEIRTFFNDAALWRLLQKREYLLINLIDENELFSGGIAMALGYKHNTQAFLDLYLWLKRYRDCPFDEILAAALGVSGFFEERYSSKWGNSEKYLSLKTIWGALRQSAEHQAHLILHQVRPFNHPVRRIIYLCKLIEDATIQNKDLMLKQLWHENWLSCESKRGCKILYRTMLDLIPSYTDPHWNHHYTFEKTAKRTTLPLLGEERKRDIAINTFLPILYFEIMRRGFKDELRAFLNFYSYHPSSKSGKTSYLIHRFFGDTSKSKALSKISCEQGAFQLHRDFCLHYEASCVGCPFVERYLALKH